MKVKNTVKITSSVAIVVLLASCGGGMTGDATGAGEDTGMEPVAGAASGSTDPSVVPSGENSNPDGVTQISGRVADGYLQGATVCVDLDNSDSCDENEPSALTGAGGLYDLTIPAGAEDKSIVAEIPAQAIDEDTGEAIGKPLVFVAPADQPEFISPMTTLVHQELQSNPSLNVEEAEDAVKTLLGVSGEDVSLFADYVAGSREGSGDVASESDFKYLHDTAKVVTSMMKDIESEVQSAAQFNGVDVAGSEENQRAIRDIVRRQVRQLLPAIAQQVAVIVGGEQSSASDQETDADANTEFDPEKIARALRPDDVTKDVKERIDAVVERVEPVPADIEQLLTEGVYWMELDCYYEEYVSISIENEPETDRPSEPEPGLKPGSTTLDDDFDYDGQFNSGEKRFCNAFYGKTQLSAAGDELVSQDYYFDIQSSTWIEEIDEGDKGSEFYLVNGQWQETTFADTGPQGKVVFVDDGSAIVTNANANGTFQLKAITQSLDATTVRKHFLSDDADPAWFDLVQGADIFPSGSLAHGISVKQTNNPYRLFNQKPYEGSGEATGEASCAEYSDNCNVIGTSTNDQFLALRTLNEVREGAVQDMSVVSLHSGIGPGATMTFMLDGVNDGTLPTSGLVAWSYGYDEFYDYREYDSEGIYVESGAPYPAGHVDIDGCYLPDVVDGDVAPEIPVGFDLPEGEFELPFSEGGDFSPAGSDDRLRIEQDPDVPEDLLPPLPLLESLPLIERCGNPVVQTGEFPVRTDFDVDPSERGAVDEKPLLTRWKFVEVDGVELIEIQLPDTYRFNGDQSDEALLMAEHNGFVRLGERQAESFVDRVITYNETAFTTLRAIIEKGDYTE